MGRRSVQTFLQRRYTGGQQVPGKMLKITNQGNENQTTVRYHFTPVRISKTQNINVDKDMEKRESLCTLGGNINWCSHYGKQYEGSSKN